MNDLPKVVTRRKKRLGRGYGSGKGGHTSSRGTKGQRSRSGISIIFEGIKMRKSFIKRLPVLRGEEKLKAKNNKVEVKTQYLNLFKKGEEVTVDTLIEKGILSKDARRSKIKLISGGNVDIALKVKIAATKGATDLVEKAGGKVE